MDGVTYLTTIKKIRDKIPEIEHMDFDLEFYAQKKSNTVALVLSVLFGFLGLDRFYLGQITLGLLKLLTLGGCGIWVVSDWFLIVSATRVKNIQIAQNIQQHNSFGVL